MPQKIIEIKLHLSAPRHVKNKLSKVLLGTTVSIREKCKGGRGLFKNMVKPVIVRIWI